MPLLTLLPEYALLHCEINIYYKKRSNLFSVVPKDDSCPENVYAWIQYIAL